MLVVNVAHGNTCARGAGTMRMLTKVLEVLLLEADDGHMIACGANSRSWC